MPSPLSKPLVRGLATLVCAALSFGLPIRILVGIPMECLLGRPFVSSFDHALAQTSGSSQGNMRRSVKPRTSSPQGGSSAWGDPLGASSESGSDSELDDFAKETDASLHSFHAGNASLDVAFPGGGSGVLEGSAGARVMLTNRMGVAFAFLAGAEKEQKRTSFGAALKFQQVFPTSTRVFPYAWVSLTGGKNGGSGNAGDTDFKAGAGAGGGLELFLLKELSLSAEAGITSQVSPGKSFRLATGTSQLALHLFLGK